jgi:hypothetical protein
MQHFGSIAMIAVRRRASFYWPPNTLLLTPCVVRVWLLGVSVFQRRAGYCRYTDIVLNGPGGSETLI